MNKLKAAAAEIKAILEKYDIAGVVALHQPERGSPNHGQGEFVLHLTPSYSVVKLADGKIYINNQPAGHQIRSDRRSDEPADQLDYQLHNLQRSVNMIVTLLDTTGHNFMVLDEIKNTLARQVKITKDRGPISYETE